MPIFTRKERPPQFAIYAAYKPYLRRDFQNRCCYCLLHEGDEQVGGGFHSFQIDHFKPVALFPEWELAYDNLYYTCRWCNRAKWDNWPSQKATDEGFRFVDPCEEDLYSTHGRVNRESGKIEWRTAPGEYTIRTVKLNRKLFCTIRIARFEAQKEIDRCKIRIRELSEIKDPVATELLNVLNQKITELEERFINPKIPYEQDDLNLPEALS